MSGLKDRRSLRIALVSPFHFSESSVVGGGERYVQYLARGLSTYYPEADLHEIYLADRNQSNLLSQRHRASFFSPARYPNGKACIPGAMVEALSKCDVVHVHQPFTTVMEGVIFAAKFLGKVVVASDHGWVDELRGRRFDHFGLVDEYIGISEFGMQFLKEQTSAPITMVMGGVDIDAFTPSRHGRRGDYFLSVGRILPHKNLEMPIAALPPDASLIICGRKYDAGYASELEALAKGKSVEFLYDATDQDIIDLYRGALATALCSTHFDSRGVYHRQPELMGFTLLESMACGTPAICTRVGGMPEYIDEGVTGFVVDTVDDLTRVYEGLLNGRYHVDELGRNARQRVVDKFSARSVASGMMSVYLRQLVPA